MSVDLPAPLSPSRPTTSPRLNFRLTPLSACTPEYHLCKLRTAISEVDVLRASAVVSSSAYERRAASRAGEGIVYIAVPSDVAPCGASMRWRPPRRWSG